MKDRDEYRTCTRCVMDTTDPSIAFDHKGVCSHCNWYDVRVNEKLHLGPEGMAKLQALIKNIKERQADKEYDCIMGLSGGVDSSYAVYRAVKSFGLRVLAVHMDNGWNSEEAVFNIERLLAALNLDLITYVVDWEEFKDIQLSYLKAGVIDIEAITDHAIIATVYKIAEEKDIPFILSGFNFETEAIMPLDWTYEKRDLTNLLAIHKEFGEHGLETFPCFTFTELLHYLNKFRSIDILNYTGFNRKEGVSSLVCNVRWKAYGGKHYESVFTRFYQGYILPLRFSVDKRKAHFSTLINSGQMTREEAIDELQKPPCPPDMLRTDKEYVLKKLDLSEKKFNELMALPIRKHTDYASDLGLFNQIRQQERNRNIAANPALFKFDVEAATKTAVKGAPE